MVVYKSRIKNISSVADVKQKLPKIAKRVVKRVRKRATKRGGGLKEIRALTDRQAFNFVKGNPQQAIALAQELVQQLPRTGGGFGKSFAIASSSALVGLGAGALGFRSYLISNPGEASKLAAMAISKGVSSFFGGGLSTGGRLSSANRLNNIGSGLRGGGISIAEQEQDEESLSGGALINPSLAIQATQQARNIIRDSVPPIGALGQRLGKTISKQATGLFSRGGSLADKLFDNKALNMLKHQHMVHIVQNMNPHEFGLVRGIASKFLNRPHPLDNHLSQHIKGGFLMPKGLEINALKDIIRAPSPHHLAEALHSEFLDFRKGMKTGGGLFDSIKSVFSKGLEGARTGTKSLLSVGRSFDTMLRRGLVIATAIEPLISAINPGLGEVFASAIKTAKLVNLASGTIVKGADVVHAILHGDAEDTLDKLGEFQLSEANEAKLQSAKDVLESARGIQQAVTGASEAINVDDPEAAGTIDEKALAELSANLEALDEANI